MSSTTDKAGEKLLASIRKTKASDGPSEADRSTPSAATPSRAAPTRRKVARKARARTAAKPAAAKPSAATKAPASATASDPYQAAPRIWPD